MHFRHISAKIQPKILNLFIISSYQYEVTFRFGGPGPLGPPPGYALGMKQHSLCLSYNSNTKQQFCLLVLCQAGLPWWASCWCPRIQATAICYRIESQAKSLQLSPALCQLRFTASSAHVTTCLRLTKGVTRGLWGLKPSSFARSKLRKKITVLSYSKFRVNKPIKILLQRYLTLPVV